MPRYFEIPLSPTPQRFAITLGGVDYTFTLRYRNVPEGGWYLDIADSEKTPIVDGIPLVTGVNLLAQYKHLGFTGRLWVQTIDDPDATPTFDNLGVGSKLYFVTD